MDLRINTLRSFENGSGVEVALGAIHHLKQDAALAREPNSSLGKSGLEAAGGGMRINALATGNSLCVG